MQRLALGAGGVAAQGLLAALVARHAVHLVIDAVAVRAIAVLEQLPAHAWHMSAYCAGPMVSTAG